MTLDSSREGRGLHQAGTGYGSRACPPHRRQGSRGALRRGQEAGGGASRFHQGLQGPKTPPQSPFGLVWTQELGPCLLNPRTEEGPLGPSS